MTVQNALVCTGNMIAVDRYDNSNIFNFTTSPNAGDLATIEITTSDLPINRVYDATFKLLNSNGFDRIDSLDISKSLDSLWLQ